MGDARHRLCRLCFSSGRWNIGVTAWVWPFAFLFFSRQTQTKKQFLLLAAAIAVGQMFKWPDILDSGYSLSAVFCLVWSVCWILPFLADRLLAQKLPGAFLSSLIFTTVFIADDYLYALTPLGTLGMMAYTQAGFLPLVQVTSMIGSFGLSFLLFWFGSAVVTVLEKRQGWKPAAGVCLALLVASVGFGFMRLAGLPMDSKNTVRVASVVGPYYEKFDDGTYAELSTDEGLQFFLSEAQRAADGGAQIACWNEEAFNLCDADEPRLLDAAAAFAKEHDMILIVGYEIADTDDNKGSDSVNKSILIKPDGSVADYIKTNLIPLVEVPGYVKGTGDVPSAMTAQSSMISNVICSDDTFPGFVRENTGATDILFVPSRDWQATRHAHTDLSEFRATENGCSLVKPTYGGISTAVDGQGRVIRRFDTDDTGFDTVQFADVPTKSVPTVYARHGDIIDLAFCLPGFVTVALGIYVLRKKGQSH